MIKRHLLFIAVFCSGLHNLLNAQSTLILNEDFENLFTNSILNDTSLGSNYGSNVWIINNQYDGLGFYPNTISQDSTFGGTITSPNGKYLHIHNTIAAANNNVENTNYDPQIASDRFTLLDEFCTLGYTGVSLSYFYLCMGDSANAFGSVYYSINNGAWVAFSGATYYNTYKWKFTTLTDSNLDNQSNVKIGFRWENTSWNSTPTASFAIDDINVAGNFDINSVGIIIDSLSLVPVCPNFTFIVPFHLTNTLCGQGLYQVELSNAAGNFINPINIGVYQLSNLSLNQSLNLSIPVNTIPGACYKLRIVRIDVTPTVVSNISNCFEVINCVNTINPIVPPMLSAATDTICVGSVIDVPFFSTGTYSNNTYTIELSDSLGNFFSNINVLGSFISDVTFDPSLGSLPGLINGMLTPSAQAIPAGCNYYIRVASSNASAVSSTYGPFCIKLCDIKSNTFENIHACISSTIGFDTIISISIHQNDSSAVYAPNNLFQVQLLNSINFSVENTGAFGSINASDDTTLLFSIPNLSNLLQLGLQPGIYYARVVASNSSNVYDNLGTLFRVIIGSPSDTSIGVFGYNPTNFTGFIPINDSIVCTGDAIYFTMLPSNNASIYEWRLNNQSFGNNEFTGVIFNQAGDYTMQVIETNYGCVGVASDTALIHVLDVPIAMLTGPVQVPINDTIIYTVGYNNYNTYNWNCNNAVVINEDENNFEILFTSAGNYQLQCTVSNMCSSVTTTKNVQAVSGIGLGELSNLNHIKVINSISDDNFQILLGNNLFEHYLFQIYQSNGVEVYSKSIERNDCSSNYDLALSHLKAGIYFLKITSNSQSKIFKIVKV